MRRLGDKRGDSTVREMKKLGLPVTRDNFIASEWMGDAYPEEWTAEYESQLPEELQDWSKFEFVKGQLRLKKGA